MRPRLLILAAATALVLGAGAVFIWPLDGREVLTQRSADTDKQSATPTNTSAAAPATPTSPAAEPAAPALEPSPPPAADRPALPTEAALSAARRYANKRQGLVAFAVVDTQGHLHGLRLDRGFPSASVVKAMLLVAYLRAAQRGELALDSATRETLRRMIELSDNDAASMIYGRLGDRRLAALAKRARMTRFSTLGYWGDNNVTARDQSRFFWLLPGLLPRSERAFALSLLAHVTAAERWGIPAGVQGWRVYFKGGWKDGTGGRLVHQVARLERRRQGERQVVTLAILTESPSQAYGEETLRRLAHILTSG